MPLSISTPLGLLVVEVYLCISRKEATTSLIAT